MQKKFFGEGWLILVTLIWGATFPIIKTALYDVSPMTFIAIRFTAASLLLLPFIIKHLRNLSRATITAGFLLGISYFLGFVSQTIGLKYTSATKSAFITGTFIIFIPLFQLLFEKKTPGKGNLIGVVLVLVGLIFLSSKGTSFFDIFNELGSNFNLGDFFTFLCAFFFALYVVYLDIVSKKHEHMPLVFFQISVTAAGGLIFLPVLAVTGIEAPYLILNENVVFALLYTSILSTIITTILQTKFQKAVTPTKAGVILSLEPIFASVFAFFMLHEKISNFGVLGCILIFTGLLASEVIGKGEDN